MLNFVFYTLKNVNSCPYKFFQYRNYLTFRKRKRVTEFGQEYSVDEKSEDGSEGTDSSYSRTKQEETDSSNCSRTKQEETDSSNYSRTKQEETDSSNDSRTRHVNCDDQTDSITTSEHQESPELVALYFFIRNQIRKLCILQLFH